MSIGSYIALLVIAGGPVPVAASAANWSDPTGERGLVHRFLVASLVWTNVQVAMLMSILALGVLNPWSLLVTEFALATLGTWLYLRAPRLVCDPSRASGSLTWIAAASAAVMVSTAWRVLSHPVDDFDSLHYHLPQLVEWIQAGSLVPMRHVAGVLNTYAFGWESLAAVFVMPLGQDVLVSAPNLLAWLMYSAASYVLARQVGAPSYGAALGSLLLLSFPIVRVGVAGLQVDLAFGAFFVMGLYFALCYAKGRAPADLAAFTAASASLFWVKLSALPYGLVLVAALGAMLVIFRLSAPRDAERKDARATVAAVIIGLLAFAPALYFYGRNWFELSNPFGYAHLPPFFDGDVMKTAFWRETTLLNLFDFRLQAHREVLRDVLVDNFGFPGLVTGVFGIAALFQVRKRRRLVLPISILPVALLLYLATPYSGDNWPPFEITHFIGQAMRYGFGWIAMATVLASAGMSVVPRWAAVALALYVSAHTVLASPGGNVELLGASFAGLAVFLLYRQRWASPSRTRLVWRCVITVGLVAAFLVLGLASRVRSGHRAACYGPVVAYLDLHAAEGGSLALRYDDENADAQPVYPLYGPNLSRRLHVLRSSESRPREFLEARGVRWVLVAQAAQLDAPASAYQLRATAVDRERGWLLLERRDHARSPHDTDSARSHDGAFSLYSRALSEPR